MRRLVLLVAALSSTSCAHFDGDGNAPGIVDPRAVPKDGYMRAPRDPGEQMIMLSPGPFMGGGATVDTKNGTRGSYSLGAEASLHFARKDHSHAEDDFFIFPETTFALNTGWTLLSRDHASPTTGYLELQYMEAPCGIAGGIAWNPRDKATGPQATGFCGPLYLRTTWLIDDNATIEAGIMIKFPVTWVESQ